MLFALFVPSSKVLFFQQTYLITMPNMPVQPAVRLKTALKPHEKAWACLQGEKCFFGAFCGFCNSRNFSSDPGVTRYTSTDFVRQEVNVTRYRRIDFNTTVQ